MFAAAIACSSLVPAASRAQISVSRDTVISVTATRTSRISPDRATIFVVVEGIAELPADAVTRNETKTKAVVEALKGIGSGVEVDRAITYSVGPMPSNNGFPNTAPPTSVARAVVRVQVNRLEQLARVMSIAIASGAANTSAPQFESTMVDSARRVRIADALAGAKADAQTIATLLDGHLGALVDVNTNSAGVFVQPAQLYFDNRFSGSTAAPEIPVSVSVTVRYRIAR